MDNKRLVVFLEDDLLRSAKVQAAKEGITLKKLVTLCLSEYILRNKKRG